MKASMECAPLRRRGLAVRKLRRERIEAPAHRSEQARDVEKTSVGGDAALRTCAHFPQRQALSVSHLSFRPLPASAGSSGKTMPSGLRGSTKSLNSMAASYFLGGWLQLLGLSFSCFLCSASSVVRLFS